MSRRTRNIALATAAVFLALLIGIYAGVLNTSAGRRAILDALGPTLNEAVGGKVHIGGTGGSWPQYIVLRDVTIADKDGIWLKVPELSVRWNPLMLIKGRIRVEDLAIPGGTLSRLPASEDTEAETPGLPRLPRLPDLKIGSMTIGALELGKDVAGGETVLRLTGSADMRSDRLKVSLKTATEPSGTDKAEIDIGWRPAENHLTADVLIEGAEGGLMTQLSGIGKGPLSLSISGTGPASEWVGAVKAQVGDLARVFGDLGCTCSVKPQFIVRLNGVPGPGLSDDLRRYLGESPLIEAALLSPRTSTWTIELTALKTSALHLTRPMRLQLTEAWRLLRFDISGALKVGPALKDTVPEWIGHEVSASARGAFGNGGSLRVVSASAASETVQLDIKDAQRTANGTLAGEVSLQILTAKTAPKILTDLAGEDARLTFALAGNADQTIRLQNVSLKTKAGTGAHGTVAYALKQRTADADLDVTLPPPVFALLTGVPEPGKPVTGHVAVKGPVSDLSASLQVQTPELTLDPRPLPPAETTLAVTGGMENPSGKLTVRRRDKPKAPPLLLAELAWPERNVLHVTNLRAEIDGARLDGEAHFTPRTGSLTGKAKLNVPDFSVLAADAAGSLSADLSLERQAQGDLVMAASAASPKLIYGGYGVSDLKMDASGPLSNLKVTLLAKELDAPETGLVRDLNSAGALNLTEGVDVTLNKFTALLEGTAVSLKEPARVTVRDGTTEILPAKFSWGEKGRLTAAATFTPDALKANLDMTKAAIPGQAVLASGSITVDTDEKQPGSIDLRLDPGSGTQVFMKLTGAWNGRTVEVKGVLQGYGKQAGLGRKEILTASIPLALSQTQNRLHFSTDGALSAALKYRGEVGALTALLLPEEKSVLSGNFIADIEVTGTLDNPRIDGTAGLDQGRYENVPQGIKLSAIEARVQFAGGLEAAKGDLKLMAWDGGEPGRGQPPVSGEGQITLVPDGLRVDADLRLRKADLVQRSDFDATLSGTANLSGTFPKLALTGDIEIDKLDLLIPESEPGGVVDVPVVLVNEKGEPLYPEEAGAEIAEAAGFELTLDLKVHSDGQAFVRGRGLESEWKSALSVGGTIKDPKLTGNLTLKKGTFTFGGRRFEISKGTVTFTGQSPPDPVLDVSAEHETQEGTRALVLVSGRTSKPTITLQSEPALPKEDVMAYVLFGKPVTELTALQALQVTQSVAQLTGTGPFGGGSILDRARRTLGLDLLDLTFGKDKGSVGLTIGSYVSQGVFVSASQDVTGEGGKVSVEVEITDEFSVKTDVGQDAAGNVSAQWKKDY